MRILVAGATSAIGKQLLPALATAGHDVIPLMPGDALDRDTVVTAVRTARPDVIVQLDPARPESIDTVLAAAWEVGVRRVVAGVPLDADPVALRYVEEEVLAARGIVLRYSAFVAPAKAAAVTVAAIGADRPGRYDVGDVAALTVMMREVRRASMVELGAGAAA